MAGLKRQSTRKGGLRRPTTADPGDVVRGLVAGLIGGLAASWVMTQFQNASTKVAQKIKGAEQSSGGGESATVKVADAAAKAVAGRPVPQEHRQTAGNVVHYAYGTLIGGVYGALAEVMPGVRMGAGTGYGATAWLLGDEVMVPLLGLSGSPLEHPLSTHAYALASHLVYGAALEGVQQATRAAM